MSGRLLQQPTEPETDLYDKVLLTISTSNDCDKLFDFDHVEPSVQFDATQHVKFSLNDYDKLFDFDHVESSVQFDATQHVKFSLVKSTASQTMQDIEHTQISNLGEAGYHILKPIPVKIRRVGIGEFEASFCKANIAMPRSSSNDALQALLAEILETFDVLIREQNLGPDATMQHRTLRTYIVRM